MKAAERKAVQVQKFDYSKTQNHAVGIVDVARWEQYSQANDFPFKAMWYCIPPGGNSPLDQHPEIELSLVMRGEATVESGGTRTVVKQGSAFLMSTTEPHIVHNTSDEPLLIFSAYWMPDGVVEGQP